MEIEDIIKQSIIEQDSIQAISDSLLESFEVSISPITCSKLVLPLIEHAMKNKHLEQEVLIYVTVISSIYTYILSEEPAHTNVVFEECAKLIKLLSQLQKKSFIVDRNYENDLTKTDPNTQFNLLVIVTEVCSNIISIDNSFSYNAFLAIVWDTLPQLIKLCDESKTNSVSLLKSIINFCKTSLEKYYVDYDDSTVYYLIVNSLKLINRVQLSSEAQQLLIQFVIWLIEFCPELKLTDTSIILSFFQSYASKNKNNGNSVIARFMFNLSNLLIKNDTKVDWYPEDLLQNVKNSNDGALVDVFILDLLKEKQNMLLTERKNTNENAMDVDEDRGVRSWNLTPEPVSNTVCHIIQQLTRLNNKNELSQHLISQLKYVSTIMDNTDVLVLCQPYMKDIAEFVTRILVIDPEFAEDVTGLFDFEIPKFVSAYIEYTLPYAIFHMDDDDGLSCISVSLGTKVTDLCKTYACHILVYFLMEENEQISRRGHERLSRLFSSKSIIKTLAKENSNKITATLAMYLGVSDLKAKALNALMKIKDLLPGKIDGLSDYISSYFIAIIERISHYISKKRDRSIQIQDPQALDALEEIMILLRSNIKDHTLHLMKLFETINALPNMQLKALSLWKKFISLLEDDALIPLLNAVTKGLIDILTVSNREIRISVVAVLEELILKKPFIKPEDYNKLPILPDYEELEYLKQVIDQQKKMQNATNQLKKEIQEILKGFSDFDDLKVLIGLQKLDKILTTNAFDSLDLRDQLYSKLFYLIGKYGSNQQISYLAAVCLGKLGALDPGMVQMSTIDDTIFVMNDFHRQDEKLEFICDLIINHIYPAYNAVTDLQIRQYIEYSIQTLLGQAGYRPVREMKSKPTLLAVYTSWRKLPKSIQEFLTPFLESSYQVSSNDQPLEYPIFPKSKSFQDWVQDWYCHMTSFSKDPANAIFIACIPMVRSNLIDITLHLLPYLALHIILSGTSDNVRGLIDELMLVFETNTRPNDHSGRGKMNHDSLQVAVSITEYCRKWLNHVGLRDVEKKSQVSRVDSFLQLIPSITMGIAAFHTKSYTQALMQLETHIKENGHEKSIDPVLLNYLQQIYIQLDDPLSLKVLMDNYASVLSLEEEIFRYESLGKWSEAEVLYRNKIQNNPLDISSYEGYMECLKKSGNYETLLYIADKEFSNVSSLSPQINSFIIDSAWKLKDWGTLDKAVSSPMQRDFQALVGCALDHMLRNRPIEASCTIEEARLNIIKQIKMSTHKSYPKYYPLIFKLQSLQELEKSQMIWETENPASSLQQLQSEWKITNKMLMPRSQYKIRLLELRKAAYFDIRNTAQNNINESELWLQIAKENRKLGNMAVSLNALLQAERLSSKPLYLEKAKWFWKNGYTVDAVRLIKSKNVVIEESDPRDALFLTDMLIDEAHNHSNTHRYHARSLKVGPEKLEKAYHNFGTFFLKYFPPDRRIKSKKLKIQIEILKFSANALKYGSKYYYSSMSRLINTWLDIANTNFTEELKRDPDYARMRDFVEQGHNLMEKVSKTIPVYQFSPFLTRLISHLSTDDTRIANCLTDIISEVFMAYPRNTIWLMMGSVESHSVSVSCSMTKILDIAKEKKSHTQIPTIIQQAVSLKRGLFELSKYDDKNNPEIDISIHPKYSFLLKLKDLDLYLPKESTMLPTLPEIIKQNSNSYYPFPSVSPTIKGIGHQVLVMKSLQTPKKISFYGSDGGTYAFLLKKKDDLRKDARTMEFNYMINHFLKKNPDSRGHELYIRTYAVIPMGDRWGLIEWINNLSPLKTIVNEYWEAASCASVNQVGVRFNKAALSLQSEKKKFFEQKILPSCPPVFYKWFLKHFPESNQWLNSRTRYIKTLAVMSIVGYIIGLGDRHAENILFDQTNGDCIHVDLNMLFGSGTTLPVPEVVPFRLTQNLVSAMGIFGYKGLFQKICEVTLQVLRDNKDSLLSVYQTYVNELEASEKLTNRSHRSSQVISHQVLTTMENRFEMNINAAEKVRKLIEVATSNEKLSQMFVGWCPFV